MKNVKYNLQKLSKIHVLFIYLLDSPICLFFTNAIKFAFDVLGNKLKTPIK